TSTPIRLQNSFREWQRFENRETRTGFHRSWQIGGWLWAGRFSRLHPQKPDCQRQNRKGPAIDALSRRRRTDINRESHGPLETERLFSYAVGRIRRIQGYRAARIAWQLDHHAHRPR